MQTRKNVQALLAALAEIGEPGNIGRELQSRWSEMNKREPMPTEELSLLYQDSPRQIPQEMQRIDLAKVIHGGSFCQAWGQINNRPGQCAQIVYRAFQEEPPFTDWFRRGDGVSPIYLSSMSGPYGNVYQVASDGRHRIHTYKAFGFRHINAHIEDHLSEIQRGSELTFLGRSIKYLRVLERVGMISNIDQKHSAITATSETSTSIPWLFEEPIIAEQYSRSYRRAYPNFGRGSLLEERLLNAESWRKTITGRGAWSNLRALDVDVAP